MFLPQMLDTLELENNRLLDDNIRKILADNLPLVEDRKRRLPNSLNPSSSQLPQQGSLINLLKKSSPERIRDLKHSPKILSVSKSGYRRSSAFIGGQFIRCAPDLKILERNSRR